MADWVYVCDFDHRMDNIDVPIKDQGIVKGPVRIGPDTWIATKVTILRGTTIGRGCVLGSHAVVKGDIPDYLDRGRRAGQGGEEPQGGVGDVGRPARRVGRRAGRHRTQEGRPLSSVPRACASAADTPRTVRDFRTLAAVKCRHTAAEVTRYGRVWSVRIVRQSCAQRPSSARVRRARRTSAAEYKQVTVLFADVVHSMDLAAAVGAERLREIMTDLFNCSSACGAALRRDGRQVHWRRHHGGVRGASRVGRPRITRMLGRVGDSAGGRPARDRGEGPRWLVIAIAGWIELWRGDRR